MGYWDLSHRPLCSTLNIYTNGEALRNRGFLCSYVTFKSTGENGHDRWLRPCQH